MKTVRLLCLLFVFIFSPSLLAQEINSTKAADIRRLIELSGQMTVGKEVAITAMQGIFRALRKTRPDVPERVLNIVEKEGVAALSDSFSEKSNLADMIVPVYDKHYTHQEIRELLAFYQSPVGEKTLRLTPTLINEGRAAGERWIQAMFPEMQRRVEAALKREGLTPLRNPQPK